MKHFALACLWLASLAAMGHCTQIDASYKKIVGGHGSIIPLPNENINISGINVPKNTSLVFQEVQYYLLGLQDYISHLNLDTSAACYLSRYLLVEKFYELGTTTLQMIDKCFTPVKPFPPVPPCNRTTAKPTTPEPTTPVPTTPEPTTPKPVTRKTEVESRDDIILGKKHLKHAAH